MRIGELTQRSGLSKETIRHYEDKKLIYSTHVCAGTRKYRDFDESTLERLQYIEVAKTIGFSLRETKPYLDAYMNGELSDAQQVQMLNMQIDAANNKIKKLNETKKFLRELLKWYEQ